MTRDEWAKRPGRSSTSRIRKSLRFAIYARDSFCCLHCGMKGEMHGAGLTLDHVRPRNKGGTNEPSNLITACLVCNSARQDKSVGDFAVWRWGQQMCLGTLPRRLCPACQPEIPNVRKRVNENVRRATRRKINRELGRWLANMAADT